MKFFDEEQEGVQWNSHTCPHMLAYTNMHTRTHMYTHMHYTQVIRKIVNSKPYPHHDQKKLKF